jgi:hypothetical protein
LFQRIICHLNAQAITATEFERRLDAAWSKLQADPQMSTRLKGMHLDASELEGKARDDVIQIVSGRDAGLTGLETIAINIATGVAVKIFEAVILPAIVKGLNREDVKVQSKTEAQAVSDASSKP